MAKAAPQQPKQPKQTWQYLPDDPALAFQALTEMCPISAQPVLFLAREHSTIEAIDGPATPAAATLDELLKVAKAEKFETDVNVYAVVRIGKLTMSPVLLPGVANG